MDSVWRKSSHSFSNGNCVEVALLAGGTAGGMAGGMVGLRDSKNPDGPVLRFTPGEFAALIRGMRNL